MSDEELLKKYHHYIKKRRIFICILLFLILIAATIIYFFPSSVHEEKVIEKETDVTAPVIVLKTNNISIYQNESIDYLNYIESVKDAVDGELKDKIQYNKIDTSKVGNYEIIYSVSDSSNNSSEAKLIVEIKEKIIESVPEEEKNTSSSNKTSSSTSSNNNKTTSPIIDNTKKPTNKIVKYFLFEDGYNMSNVAEECAKELKKLGVAGMCSPIQDESGIYLGMKLETN